MVETLLFVLLNINMRTKLISLSFILLPILVFACAPKDLPVELKPAYTANEVLIRVNELQRTAISLYDSTPKGITKSQADVIVKFTTSSASIIKQSMNGWQGSVKQSWAELNKVYKPTDTRLQTIWNLIDVMMGVI